MKALNSKINLSSISIVLQLYEVLGLLEYRECIYFLNMGVRASNCLIAEQIYTIGSLIQKSERELLRAPNLGRKTLNDIKYTLDDWGLKLNTKLYSYRGEIENGS